MLRKVTNEKDALAFLKALKPSGCFSDVLGEYISVEIISTSKEWRL